MRFSPTRWVGRRFDRLLRRPVVLSDDESDPWTTERIGRFGEDAAARWLWLEGGCRILYRNFRAPEGGEIDIACRHRETLVFAEVKTRTSDRYGRPAFAVDTEKQRLIIRGAREWMRLLEWPRIVFRFDIVEVRLNNGRPPEITWLQSAFHLPPHELW